jgi:hypothetical protein
MYVKWSKGEAEHLNLSRKEETTFYDTLHSSHPHPRSLSLGLFLGYCQDTFTQNVLMVAKANTEVCM